MHYYSFLFIIIKGLIVPEGERWKEQRQFAVSTLRDLGMVKFGAKRSHMEQRIMKGVQALFRVRFTCHNTFLTSE